MNIQFTRAFGMSFLIRLRRKIDSMTLWYRRLQTDKDPRYAVSNLLKLQSNYELLASSERAITDDMIVRIISHLVMANGTVMASRPERHTEAIGHFLDKYAASLPQPLDILELGCSLGIDGYATYQLVKNAVHVSSYSLADLNTRLNFDPVNQLAYDEDNKLIQAFIGNRAISINVSGVFKRTKWLMIACNARYVNQARQLAAKVHGAPTVEVSLLHPTVLQRVRAGELKSFRQDVLQPIKGKFGMVVAFNLLLTSYFSDDELRVALRNICASLVDGGFLILGREQSDFSIFMKSAERLTIKYSHGSGSDCDRIVGE